MNYTSKFSDFGVPFGVHKFTKNEPLKQSIGFWASWGPWGVPRGHLGLIWEGIWAPLGTILRALRVIFGTIFEVWQQQKKQTEADQAKNNKQ